MLKQNKQELHEFHVPKKGTNKSWLLPPNWQYISALNFVKSKRNLYMWKPDLQGNIMIRNKKYVKIIYFHIAHQFKSRKYIPSISRCPNQIPLLFFQKTSLSFYITHAPQFPKVSKNSKQYYFISFEFQRFPFFVYCWS